MTFWSGELLAEELPQLIEPYDKSLIDCSAYTLRVGREIYITPDQDTKSPGSHTKRQLKDNEAFAIPPGQFAFLITEEYVRVPPTAMAFISMKARVKFGGLVNVSGFHVDPGYYGRLVFSVYNAGPLPISLQQGMPLFLIWYAYLDRCTKEAKSAYKTPEYLDNSLLLKASAAIYSPQALTEIVQKQEHVIDRYKEDMTRQVHALERGLVDRVHQVEKQLERVAVIGATLLAILLFLVRNQIADLFQIVH